jgi:hypothetical protein
LLAAYSRQDEHDPLALYLAASACWPAAPPSRWRRPTSPSIPAAARAEQLAVTFEKVDLALRVDPASKSIRGDATLTFLLKEPLTRIAVELDRNLPVDSASVDGVRWRRRHQQSRRPPLPDAATPLPAGARTTVRIQYHGVPVIAKHAPWDGGFTWSQTATASRGSPPPSKAKAATCSGLASIIRRASPN